MTDALTVQAVSSGYGQLTILRDISFGVPVGSTLGILGQNGAGKSTLLKTIAGLLPCNTGSIVFEGRRIERLPTFRRVRGGLSLVPEGRQIFGEMTVEENLRLALSARAVADAGARQQAIDQVYELFPMLLERRQQHGASLSGGQQQMLAIGRALVAHPRVLMLDEPTQGLAPVVVGELRIALKELKRQFSMIIVEQNQEFIAGLADEIVRMDEGQLNSRPDKPGT